MTTPKYTKYLYSKEWEEKEIKFLYKENINVKSVEVKLIYKSTIEVIKTYEMKMIMNYFVYVRNAIHSFIRNIDSKTCFVLLDYL